LVNCFNTSHTILSLWVSQWGGGGLIARREKNVFEA